MILNVDGLQALLECGCSGNNLCLGIERKGPTFKDDFILATHQMRIDQRQSALLHTLAHLNFALEPLAHMEGGCVQHQQQLRASIAGILCGRFKPCIFTDQQTHFHAGDFKHTGLMALCEIPTLVKHLVIGQFLFGVGGNDLPLAQDTGPVVTLCDRNTAALDATTIRVPHHHMQTF